MRIFDCTTYFNEPLIMDVRFNILNEHVTKFIIVESTYSHSGAKKKINFDKNLYPQFKDKIEHIIVEKEPENILDTDNADMDINKRTNSILRISLQRNEALKACKEASEEDYIFYSDNDEIPNFNEINFYKNKSKLIIFEQKLFYYKFNLLCDRIFWYGSRAIKKKDLINFEWFRQIKPKKYPLYRVDTLFKSNKYIDLKIIKNGGWHFTRVLSPEEIHKKELDAEHHDEYRLSKKDPAKIKDLIKRRVIDHNHLVDKTKDKYRDEFKLKKIPNKELPDFISNNIGKYKDFLDLED